ncbi:hypothetical protein [Cellulosimicrobium cellulans]|uniref:Uncharacterized protein n=1 Tax=Cellulosimicrobium cellulans TaxID=1710 RepID=A0A4Y4E6P1_CELCE|nr:hypothetical protein [Cellulosimicrobium cellulans]GED11615.1 hypothetical protein CCE02nite_36140 [Cellulosimicrobium cellulans]
MTDGWSAAIVLVGLVGWTLLADVCWGAEERLAGWWVARARSRGAWAGPWSFLVSMTALVGYGLVVWLGEVLAATLDSPTSVLLVVVPAALAYSPFAVTTAPLSPSGYLRWRASLESAGADTREQRNIAWWAGPPSLLGLGAIVLTLFQGLLG